MKNIQWIKVSYEDGTEELITPGVGSGAQSNPTDVQHDTAPTPTEEQAPKEEAAQEPIVDAPVDTTAE